MDEGTGATETQTQAQTTQTETQTETQPRTRTAIIVGSVDGMRSRASTRVGEAPIRSA